MGLLAEAFVEVTLLGLVHELNGRLWQDDDARPGGSAVRAR